MIDVIPTISIVGKSNSGKTTLIEKLLPEIRKRNYKIGTIKHDVHGFEIDHEGKDTYKFYKAGSDSVVISSENKIALIKNVNKETQLDELTSNFLPDMDLIITEGYKRQHKPKIEVCRQSISEELLCKPEELIAVVSDINFDIGVPHFGLDDINLLADLIENKFLKPKKSRRVELIVDNKFIPIKDFVQDTIAATIRGLVSTLRGVEEGVKEINIKIRI